MYADDHQIVSLDSSNDEVAERLQQNRNEMTNWYEENLLKVNIKKYQLMVLCPNKNIHGIHLCRGGDHIKQFSNLKLLGIYTDLEVNFSTHISVVSRKISQQNGVVRTLSNLISRHANLQLHKAATSTHLTHCSAVCHFCKSSDKCKLERRTHMRMEELILLHFITKGCGI